MNTVIYQQAVKIWYKPSKWVFKGLMDKLFEKTSEFMVLVHLLCGCQVGICSKS